MDALHTAFLELIEHKPLDQITIKEITTAAGVSYPTFFRRCAGKEDLLHNIATEEVRTLLSLGKQAVLEDGYNATSISMFNYVKSRRKLWKTLLTGGATSAIRAEFMRIASSIAETRPPSAPHIPVDLAIPLVTSGIMEVLTWWMNQPEDCPAEEAANLYETLVVDPVMARHSRLS